MIFKFRLVQKGSICDVITIKNIVAGCIWKDQNGGLLQMFAILVGLLGPLEGNYYIVMHLLHRKECRLEIMFSHHIVILP
jgi:hypothetical protein